MFTNCIPHNGALFPSGYGARWFEGATRRAHRVAYCIAHKVPWASIKGQLVRHKCDNRRCINPAHLELGSHADNMRDMRERNRAASGARNARTKLTPEDVEWIRANYVWRSQVLGTVALARQFNVTNSTIQRVVRGIYHVH